MFTSCNILIGSVTHMAGKLITWASFTRSLKLQLHPRQMPRLIACVAWRFWLGRQVIKAGEGRETARRLGREQLGLYFSRGFAARAPDSTKPPCYAGYPVKSSKYTLDTSDKPIQRGENQNPSVSIRGKLSNPRSKVPRRLLKAN